MMDRLFTFIGAAIGCSGSVRGADIAVECLKGSKCLELYSTCWHEAVSLSKSEATINSDDPNEDICCFLSDLAHAVFKATTQKLVGSNPSLPIVFGGDHTCAIGTWGGVYRAIKAVDETNELGLIWIDAHMDGHTPETSPTGNLHGMPLAVLLGHGNKKLCNILDDSPKVLPQNVVLIGVRSYEEGESRLLSELGVRIYEIDEVLCRGFNIVLEEAVDYLRNQVATYGISFDLDVLSPVDAPAVGTPVSNGIPLDDVLDAIKNLDKKQLIATEIVEFNPLLDQDRQTEEVIANLVECFGHDIVSC